jgi:hypothetical protein
MCLTVSDEDELGLKYDRSSDGEYKLGSVKAKMRETTTKPGEERHNVARETFALTCHRNRSGIRIRKREAGSPSIHADDSYPSRAALSSLCQRFST